MTRSSDRRRVVAAIAAATMVAATVAAADDAADFKNLKIFPKDIGKRELTAAMGDIAGALGVRCTYCHVMRTPGDPDSIDWASDELTEKNTARAMLRLVQRVNGELMPKGEKGPIGEVRCVTCHRGLTDPETLDRVLLGVTDKQGVAEAVAKYRALRGEYLGSGSYDFGPSTLLTVAQTLAAKGELAGALTMLDLNREVHPRDVSSLVVSAQVKLQQGDRAAAKTLVDEALAIEPGSHAAKRLAAQLAETP
jgi:hypothetical protein